VPTIREPDGLAISSRNKHLNREERKAALCLYNAIKKGKDIFESGVKDVDIILKEVKRVVEAEPLAVIDYVKVCGADTLKDVDIVADKALMAMAVRIGKTRLIDNCILG
jgi:pantoate--beta-alanine ligase